MNVASLRSAIGRHALGSIAVAIVVTAAVTGVAAYSAGRHSVATTPSTTVSPASIPTLDDGGGTGKGKNGNTPPSRNAAGAQVRQLLALVARQTNQTPAAVQTQLQSGSTLNTICGSQDQSIKDAAMAALKTRLDASVSNGALTSGQEGIQLMHDQTLIDQAMALPGPKLLAMAAAGATATPSPSGQ